MAPVVTRQAPTNVPADLMTRRVNRRTVLQRAGLLGLALPVSGALLAACGGDDDDKPITPINAPSNPTTGTGAEPVTNEPPTPVEITVTASEMKFEPATLAMTVGTPVTLTFHNAGVIEHDWVAEMPVTDLEVVEQPTLTARAAALLTEHTTAAQPYAAGNTNETMVVRFTPATAGEFAFACLVPGHRQGGMVGTDCGTRPHDPDHHDPERHPGRRRAPACATYDAAGRHAWSAAHRDRHGSARGRWLPR
jgi:uncharacterized cupredoxin-like copper-binding protein